MINSGVLIHPLCRFAYLRTQCGRALRNRMDAISVHFAPEFTPTSAIIRGFTMARFLLNVIDCESLLSARGGVTHLGG
jgi:hypothetical protein